MRKGRDIVGKPIISYDTGEKFDKIQDLIFDQDSNQLLGFLVNESGWLRDAKVLLLSDIQSIGADAVIVISKDTVLKAREMQVIDDILKRNNILKGTRIMTTDGRDLGTLIDLYFDEQTGAVEGYEASGGLFADVYSGRSFIPAAKTLKIGEHVAFVPSQTATLMEEQTGGVRAAIQSTSEKVQDTAQITSEKLQEFGGIAAEKAQKVARNANHRSQEVQEKVASTVTNAFVDPEKQEEFVIGKIAERSIAIPGGGYLVLEGQIITASMVNSAKYLGIMDELYWSARGSVAKKPVMLDRLAAGFSVEEVQGRRVQSLIHTNEGLIIAGPGQIVTAQVIERAKLHHKEQALINAVGLSPQEAVRNRGGALATETGDLIKLTAQETGEQLQVGAKNLWAQVKETAHEFQDRSSQVIEEKQIRRALGRPVNRVILDSQDNVILNIGELITHEAIAKARQAKVLYLLLNSVYTETPKLSLDDMRVELNETFEK
jgi:uncharacterized protein YrrD